MKAHPSKADEAFGGARRWRHHAAASGVAKTLHGATRSGSVCRIQASGSRVGLIKLVGVPASRCRGISRL